MIRVQVVDDDRSQRFLLVHWLEAAGYEVFEASDGDEALLAFEAHAPDIVLLDAMMPRMDGFETARRMRALARPGRLLQILMITALEDEASLVRGLEAGADDFVSKPMSRTLLGARIGSFARTREMFDDAQRKARTLARLAEEEQQKQAMAARLMANLLSSSLLRHQAFQLHSSAMEAFNGDLAMAAPLGPRSFRVLFGDFSGHGIEAAVGSLPVALGFEQACARREPLEAFLDAAHKRLRSVVPSHRFLAMVVMDVDLDRKRAQYFNAGMPDVVHVSRGELRRLPSTHPPLGVLPPPFLVADAPTIDLQRDDLLFFQTDGLMETESELGEPFGQARLLNHLAECGGELDPVAAAVESFRGRAAARDDATLLRLRFDPSMQWTHGGPVDDSA